MRTVAHAAAYRNRQRPGPANKAAYKPNKEKKTVEGARLFIGKVKTQFVDKPDKYRQFLDSFKKMMYTLTWTGRISEAVVIETFVNIIELFYGYPSLIMDLLIFIPQEVIMQTEVVGVYIKMWFTDGTERIIKMQDDPEQQPFRDQEMRTTETPYDTKRAITFVRKIKTRYEHHEEDDDVIAIEPEAVLDEQEYDEEEEDEGEDEEEVEEEVEEHEPRTITPIHKRVPKLPPTVDLEDKRDRPTNVREFNHTLSFVKKIKSRLEHQPEVYRHFLDILHAYQSNIDRLDPHKERIIMNQISLLFQDQLDILQEFRTFFLALCNSSRK